MTSPALRYRPPEPSKAEIELGERLAALAPFPERRSAYFHDAADLKRSVALNMRRKRLTVRDVIERTGCDPRAVRSVIDHGYADVDSTLRVLDAVGIIPANLPPECLNWTPREA